MHGGWTAGWAAGAWARATHHATRLGCSRQLWRGAQGPAEHSGARSPPLPPALQATTAQRGGKGAFAAGARAWTTCTSSAAQCCPSGGCGEQGGARPAERGPPCSPLACCARWSRACKRMCVCPAPTPAPPLPPGLQAEAGEVARPQPVGPAQQGHGQQAAAAGGEDDPGGWLAPGGRGGAQGGRGAEGTGQRSRAACSCAQQPLLRLLPPCSAPPPRPWHPLPRLYAMPPLFFLYRRPPTARSCCTLSSA